jgi:hypothetical protein
MNDALVILYMFMVPVELYSSCFEEIYVYKIVEIYNALALLTTYSAITFKHDEQPLQNKHSMIFPCFTDMMYIIIDNKNDKECFYHFKILLLV